MKVFITQFSPTPVTSSLFGPNILNTLFSKINKVKLLLYLTATAYGGAACIDPHFFDLGTIWSFTPRPHYTGEKQPIPTG